MSQEEKVQYLTSARIPRLICQMSVPTVISMLVTSLYNMADTAFVGRLDTQSTAAVGISFSIMALIQAVGFFFGQGSGNYISRQLGARQYDDAERMAATGFFTSMAVGLLIAIVGVVFISPISLLLGSTKTILPYTESYLRIIFLGTPFMIGSFVLNNQMRFQGSASSAMVGIVSGAVLNVALDPVLIFACHMGVAGAALATVISQAVGFFLLLYMNRKNAAIKVRLRCYRFEWHYYRNIFLGGVPSLCRQGLASLSTVCLNVAAGNYGGAVADAAIAAMGVVSRIMTFVNSALIGFGQGFQPVCGTSYGAGKYARVREAFYFCLKVGGSVLLVLSLLGYIFAGPLVAAFRNDPDVIRIGVVTMRAQCLVFTLNAWVVLCNMLMQTIGMAMKATIVATARQGVVFLPLVLLLPLRWGLFGVEIAQAVSDVLTFVLTLPLGVGVLKTLREDRK